MQTPEEVPLAQNGTTAETKTTSDRGSRCRPCADATDTSGLSEAEKFERGMEQLKAVLDSPAVSKFLDLLNKKIEAEPEKDRHNHELRMLSQAMHGRLIASNRGYFLMGLAISLIFLGGVIYVLRHDSDTLLPVLTAVVGLLAGAGGGFIFGQSRRDT